MSQWQIYIKHHLRIVLAVQLKLSRKWGMVTLCLSLRNNNADTSISTKLELNHFRQKVFRSLFGTVKEQLNSDDLIYLTIMMHLTSMFAILPSEMLRR